MPAPESSPHSRPRGWVGNPYPLGAYHNGSGTNFSLFSSVGDGVEPCLLGDEPDGDEVRVEPIEVDGHCWHADLPDVRRLLLDVDMLVKAMYEVRYELSNRPDRVGWPIAAIVELLGDEAP